MIFKTTGVCSREIHIEINEENQTIISVKFINGCEGNALGISKLVAGMPVDDVIQRLEGIRCGYKSTSCPDQLTIALKKWRNLSI